MKTFVAISCIVLGSPTVPAVAQTFENPFACEGEFYPGCELDFYRMDTYPNREQDIEPLPQAGSGDPFSFPTNPNNPGNGIIEPAPEDPGILPTPPIGEPMPIPTEEDMQLLSPVDGLEVPLLYGDFDLEGAWLKEVTDSCSLLGVAHYVESKRARARCGCQ